MKYFDNVLHQEEVFKYNEAGFFDGGKLTFANVLPIERSESYVYVPIFEKNVVKAEILFDFLVIPDPVYKNPISDDELLRLIKENGVEKVFYYVVFGIALETGDEGYQLAKETWKQTFDNYRNESLEKKWDSMVNEFTYNILKIKKSKELESINLKLSEKTQELEGELEEELEGELEEEYQEILSKRDECQSELEKMNTIFSLKCPNQGYRPDLEDEDEEISW